MSTDPIPLRDGPTVPAAVLLWLLGAADRGLTFVLLPTGRMRVTPRPAPGSEDDVFILAHRDALVALVAYVDRAAAWPLDTIGESVWLVPTNPPGAPDGLPAASKPTEARLPW